MTAEVGPGLSCKISCVLLKPARRERGELDGGCLFVAFFEMLSSPVERKGLREKKNKGKKLNLCVREGT